MCCFKYVFFVKCELWGVRKMSRFMYINVCDSDTLIRLGNLFAVSTMLPIMYEQCGVS